MMAHASKRVPNSNQYAFGNARYLGVADNTFLDYRSKEMYSKEVVQEWVYAVFGKVVEGMDVVDKIKGVKTGNHGFHADVPKEDVIINQVIVG